MVYHRDRKEGDVMEKYQLSKMCYSDDIKDNIEKIVNVNRLNLAYLRESVFSKSICNFIESVNDKAQQINEHHYIYKNIIITTKTGEVYNIAWNLKREFPVFIIGRLHYNMSKYLDENFCLESSEPQPEQINALLSDFKSQYTPKDNIKLK